MSMDTTGRRGRKAPKPGRGGTAPPAATGLRRIALAFLFAVLFAVLPGTVAGPPAGPASAQERPPTPRPEDNPVGLANPSATFCLERGNRFEIRDTPSGEVGVCILPDGRQVDAWTYFRQNNPPPAE